MKTVWISTLLCLGMLPGRTQTDVRAWSADGQVFVVWTIGFPIQETYAIYASPAPFTDTGDATLVGRPFALEYLGYSLKNNLEDSTATFRIPDGQGGMYQLALNEGVFVFTPHASGALYFSVNAWGDAVVTPGINITDTAVSFTYDPAGDPVECHLQRTFPSPFAAGYVCFAYALWVDGRQNEWEGRPDFPIMANAAKNGMPAIFLISAPIGLDTSQAFPLSVWLHGGGGKARQSLAGSRKETNINPVEGILVAQDDNVYGTRGEFGAHPIQPSWHFGWAKNYDPFTPNIPVTNDTIVNYTQRRYLWIDRWLTAHFHVDPHRINIHGHSMGSAGSLGLVKAFPEHYGSATIFNTGCAGPLDTTNTVWIFGTRADNFPTNLTNRDGQPVRFFDLWDLHTNCSTSRDLPLIKHWHGKSDDNSTMHWSPVVVGNFIFCDSTGTGIQDSWSERPHSPDEGPAYDDHWIKGIPAILQTANDNVDFAEAHHRSDESFPAFFNHRLDPKNRDPGTGIIGLDLGDGDNWGTWGGYHRWAGVTETADAWQVTAWLEGNAVFPNDNSPEEFLTADVAIRRPTAFLPATGETIHWTVTEAVTGDILQGGTTTVQADNLVVLPQVQVYREDIRKVDISVTTGMTAVEEPETVAGSLRIVPNPTRGPVQTRPDWADIRILDLAGREIGQVTPLSPGQPLDLAFLPPGLYFLRIQTTDGVWQVGKVARE